MKPGNINVAGEHATDCATVSVNFTIVLCLTELITHKLNKCSYLICLDPITSIFKIIKIVKLITWFFFYALHSVSDFCKYVNIIFLMLKNIWIISYVAINVLLLNLGQ